MTVRAVVTATNDYGTDSAATAASAVVAAAPPAETIAPAVVGTAVDGQTVTADPGIWSGTPPVSFAYQWQRCDADGTNCADIAGATDDTYTLTGADTGHGIRVEVTATNAAGTATATSPVAAVNAAAPQNTTPPSVSGTYVDGHTLTADEGAWSGTAPLTYEYQWLRCDADGTDCQAIAGETASTYTLTSDDVGHQVVVAVHATQLGRQRRLFTPRPRRAVAADPPQSTTAPVVTGTTEDGATLLAGSGGWTGTEPLTFTWYQWQRCDAGGASCADIAGATDPTYTLAAADVAGTVRVVVTATNAAGADTSTSLPTSAVAAAPPASTTPPAVTGTPVDGQVLTASPGTWLGTPTITYGYQWQRCDVNGLNCVNIGGATGTTYTLTPADVGSTIRVVVIGNNDAGASNPASSNQTATVVQQAPANVTLPQVNGIANDGETLTAGLGTWSGTAPLAYAYQWLRCDSAGNNCVDIVGATAGTYDLTAADVGHETRVKVTATNNAGSATATSPASSVTTADPPVNTTPPVVSGTTQDGSTLGVNLGTWTGTTPLAYAYQWQRCDSAGANCVDIAGATSSTFALTAADIGHKLRARVTATNVAGSAAVTTVPSNLVAAQPPANTTPPVISGTTQDGSTLSVNQGTWTGTAPLSYAYQWQRCDSAGANCVDIAGETTSNHVLTGADVGRKLRVRVTATNVAGSAAVTTVASSTVAAQPPCEHDAAGDQRHDAGRLDAEREPGNVDGHHSAQLRLPVAALRLCGRQLRRHRRRDHLHSRPHRRRRRAQAARPGDRDQRRRLGGCHDGAQQPRRRAAAREHDAAGDQRHDAGRLDAEREPGNWTGTAPLSYSYQWQRCDSAGLNCVDIAGQTTSTHVLTGADIGHEIRVGVTATNVAGSAAATTVPSSVVAASPPANTTLPQVNGLTQDGETLTAGLGSWTGTAPLGYTYQWRRCDAAGINCVDISGATGSSYDLTPTDVGHTIRVEVTATNVAGNDTATSSPSSLTLADPPNNTILPQVLGTTQDGETLSVDLGAWTGTSPLDYDYQWRRCDVAGANCVDIPGATNSTYDLTATDVGHTIRIELTATNGAGADTATSPPSTFTVADPPVNTTAPDVLGSTQDGDTLSVDLGTWTGTAPLSYDYQWQRCDAAGANCVDIPGATDDTYDLVPADIGHTIRVAVTATNVAGDDTATSSPSPLVVPEPPNNTTAPAVLGSTQDGETLSVDLGTWTGTAPLDYDYQWVRCDAAGANCVDIAGATDDTYDLTGNDVGHTIRVEVTATNSAGDDTATSAPSSLTLADPPVNTTPPAVVGATYDGQTLSVDLGDWTGTDPLAYDYQWQRCDAAGANCADIAGATGDTYDLGDDVGSTIRIEVTATNVAGATRPRRRRARSRSPSRPVEHDRALRDRRRHADVTRGLTAPRPRLPVAALRRRGRQLVHPADALRPATSADRVSDRDQRDPGHLAHSPRAANTRRLRGRPGRQRCVTWTGPGPPSPTTTSGALRRRGRTASSRAPPTCTSRATSANPVR